MKVPVMPDGAFYAWADCSDIAQRLEIKNSLDFAHMVMERAHIAITPGKDFSNTNTKQYVRFSTANSMSQLLTAAERLRTLLI